MKPETKKYIVRKAVGTAFIAAGLALGYYTITSETVNNSAHQQGK
jgi:NADH:ubiquinone oxidoreductase subunit 2 (subunit N)